ncbi:MAG TPA: lipoyl(octanoyl) transferase LipB [Planctomycetota bacterium]
MPFSRSPRIEVLDFGRVDYAETSARMLRMVAERAAGAAPDRILLCEFEPVLTVGRGASADDFAGAGLPVHEVSRGGKATFHGPGQVVAYPILGLEGDARDLHAYLHALEDALIRTVGDFGVVGERDPRNTGCWVGGRKIASIGVAVRRWVTYHGVALNVATELGYFGRFEPCGLEPDLMTSLAREGAAPLDFGSVKFALAARLVEVLRA